MFPSLLVAQSPPRGELDFLSGLVGMWRLEGTMDTTTLDHCAEARWAIRLEAGPDGVKRLFADKRLRRATPGPPC